MLKSLSSLIALTGILLSVLLVGCSSGVPLAEHEALQAKYDALQANYDDVSDSLHSTQLELADKETSLTNTTASLVTTQTALTTSESNLSNTQKTLSDTQAALAASQTELVTTKTVLANIEATLVSTQTSLAAADANLSTTKSTLTTTNKLLSDAQNEAIYWEQLYSITDEWYQDVQETVNRRHALSGDKTTFITPDDPAVAARVLTITGGTSTDVSERWDDYQSMYDWIVNNIDYNYDTNLPYLPDLNGSLTWRSEYWKMPSETLADKNGDCDDMATLMASMLLNYGEKKYTTWGITWTSDESAHAAVAIPVSGGELTIFDPSGKYLTKTSYGHITSNDYNTEVNNWLNHWSSKTGIYVSGIFTSGNNMTFDSTSEFLDFLKAYFAK